LLINKVKNRGKVLYTFPHPSLKGEECMGQFSMGGWKGMLTKSHSRRNCNLKSSGDLQVFLLSSGRDGGKYQNFKHQWKRTQLPWDLFFTLPLSFIGGYRSGPPSADLWCCFNFLFLILNFLLMFLAFLKKFTHLVSFSFFLWEAFPNKWNDEELFSY
jgi:hypothetical protein